MLWRIPQLAQAAVLGFILISGFVIAGLVVERREAWTPFILRRAARLFPAYSLALAASVAALPFILHATLHLPWAEAVSFNRPERFDSQLQDLAAYPFEIGALNLTLLQGLIPNEWFEATAPLPPAWSLSLEWQFYLVAPFMVAALARRLFGTVLLVALCGLALVTQSGWFGTFFHPSILTGAGYLFAIGILARLHIEKVLPALKRLSMVGNVLSVAPARYLGERSYSVYIFHMPILYWAVIAIEPLRLTPSEAITSLFAVTTFATLAVSHVTYRLVEKPAMAWASRMAGAMRTPRTLATNPPSGRH
jgi:peptidoglycan/LPS O-acetylase OafA/YrhL